MQQIPAGEFKAKCLKIMDEINKCHKEIIITKFNKPVVKIVPVDQGDFKSVFGCLKGSVTINSDIIKPTGESWHADENNI